ncbi:MAG: hypothetical protein ABI354_03095 [Candidatus Saccharimonadales bacterium]
MEHSPNFGPDYSSLEESPQDSDDDVIETKTTKKSKKSSGGELFDKKPPKLDTPEARIEKFESKAEKEPPIEALADDEKRLVAQEYVDDRGNQVKQELADPKLDDASEAAALANAAFIENVQNQLDEGGPVTPEALDAALIAAASELGIDEDDPVDTELLSDDPEPIDDLDEATPLPAAVPLAGIGGGIPAAPAPLKAPAAVPPAGSPPAPPAGGGIPMPPLPPAPMGGAALPPVPPIGVGVPAAFNRVPNVLQNTSEQPHSHIQYVLAGGIVGYLIGRRRGRIKTEKRLLPVQEKLQKEVSELQQGIIAREQKIRTLARERVIANPAFKQELDKKLELRQEDEIVKQETVAESTNEVLDKQQKREKLGGLVLQSELRPDTVKSSPEQTVKTVESMNNQQLLTIAAGIEIAGTSIKHLFEMKQINEVGLRKIVLAYARGERYERVIQEELRSPNKPSLDNEKRQSIDKSTDQDVSKNIRNDIVLETTPQPLPSAQQRPINMNASTINQIVSTVNSDYSSDGASNRSGTNKSFLTATLIFVACVIAALVWVIAR